MHREIQIKQFPIVTTHWWPKTRNDRFVWENEQYLYRFLPLVHNHVQVIWVRTHIRCVTCVWAHSGSRCNHTQLCGIFLLEDAHCHRSCRFWTVYSRIMMTSFKQTRLLSCIVFLYERSMYPFHSSVTRRQRLTEGVSEAWCFKKLFELFDSIIIYGYVQYIPFGKKWWLFNFGMAQILFMD